MNYRPYWYWSRRKTQLAPEHLLAELKKDRDRREGKGRHCSSKDDLNKSFGRTSNLVDWWIYMHGVNRIIMHFLKAYILFIFSANQPGGK